MVYRPTSCHSWLAPVLGGPIGSQLPGMAPRIADAANIGGLSNRLGAILSAAVDRCQCKKRPSRWRRCRVPADVIADLSGVELLTKVSWHRKSVMALSREGGVETFPPAPAPLFHHTPRCPVGGYSA